VNDLPPVAVEHLYPVLVIVALLVAGLVALIGGLWVGFKWLHTQIRETAALVVKPVEERVALVEKSTDAAHRRIDAMIGARP
jgi:hypothetical protein